MSVAPQPEVVTLGCRLNIAESETIRRLVAGQDVAIVNSCGVTNQAVKDTRAAIRRLHRAAPDRRVVLTGCASDIDRAAFAGMPEVAAVVPNAAKLLPSTWGARANHAPPRRHTRAFVAVQHGCDHRCTFCIIPAGRGPARAAPIAESVLEIAQAVEAGAREVVLTGVDVASHPDLAALIRAILDGVPSLERLRLSSLDPAAIDAPLFALLTGEPRIMPHVHLSIQAGDNMILKRMRRRHSRVDVLRLAERLHAARPEIALGADLIAGFPTESDAAHADTRALIAAARIVHAHVFPYSPRAGTPAARMPQVEPELARARAADLREAAAAQKARWLAGLVGTTQPVLIEKPGDRGHVPNFAEVHLSSRHPGLDPGSRFFATEEGSGTSAQGRGDEEEIGTVVPIRITHATPTHLVGVPA